MEDIDILVSESDILHSFPRHDFPVVSFVRNVKGVSSPYAYFNVKCNPIFEGFNFMRIYKTAEYLVFSPQKYDIGKCYALKHDEKRFRRITSVIFENLNVAGKTYKLYRCKQGFAIKLNEPLEKKKEVK